MNYKIVMNSVNFDVIETCTEQVIRTFEAHKEAKKFLRHLNLGGGFDGWTPTFFLKKIEIPVKKTGHAV